MEKKSVLPDLTPEQISQIGLVQARRCLNLIRGQNRNETKIYIDGLSSRHRGYIYFAAGLQPHLNRLTFAELNRDERTKVIAALRDLKSLFGSIPKILSDADSIIN